MRMLVSRIDDFIEQKKDWIEKHQSRMKDKEWRGERNTYSDDEIRMMKVLLKKYIIPRVWELFAGKNLPQYTSIKITKSERRWWSCSARNGFCFSYRLAEYLEEDASVVSSRAKPRDLHDHEVYQMIKTDSSQAQNDKKNFIDAIIIHELAHLREKNHQKPFWNLVNQWMPEYEEVVKARTDLGNI